MEDKKNESGLIRVFQIPGSQDERMRSATTGVVSLVASAGIVLLKGISSLFFPGFLISAALGVIAYLAGRKYPEQRSVAVVIAGLAGITLLNALPVLKVAGGFLLAAAAAVTAGFGLWKLVGTVFSIFKKKDS